jgi:hypothetical protein
MVPDHREEAVFPRLEFILSVQQPYLADARPKAPILNSLAFTRHLDLGAPSPMPHILDTGAAGTEAVTMQTADQNPPCISAVPGAEHLTCGPTVGEDLALTALAGSLRKVWLDTILRSTQLWKMPRTATTTTKEPMIQSMKTNKRVNRRAMINTRRKETT